MKFSALSLKSRFRLYYTCIAVPCEFCIIGILMNIIWYRPISNVFPKHSPRSEKQKLYQNVQSKIYRGATLIVQEELVESEATLDSV